MREIRVLGFAAACTLVAIPALAGEQSTDTTLQAGSVATFPATTNEALSTNIGLITSRVAASLGPTPGGAVGTVVDIDSGLAAGGSDDRVSVWGASAWRSLENDLGSIAHDGDYVTMVGGADYQMTDRLLGGVATSWEDIEVDTTYNRGSLNGDGFTVAPYVGFILNRYFTADVAGGYSFAGKSEMTRSTGGTNIAGDMDWERWFLAGNVNGYYRVNRLALSGQVGLLWAQEDQDEFTETDGTRNPSRDIEFGQLHVGGQVGYVLGRVEPFVTGRFEHDFMRDKVAVGAGQLVPENDRNGFEVGGGVNFALSERVTGGIQGTTLFGRSDVEQTTVSGNLRIKF